MTLIIQMFALLAAIVHVLIFFMESIWFMQPKVHSRFGTQSVEDAETNRLFAFNQGFYNLFLAITVFVGLGLIHFDGNIIVAQTLILSSCASMAAAALVLFCSADTQLIRAVIAQANS